MEIGENLLDHVLRLTVRVRRPVRRVFSNRDVLGKTVDRRGGGEYQVAASAARHDLEQVDRAGDVIVVDALPERVHRLDKNGAVLEPAREVAGVALARELFDPQRRARLRSAVVRRRLLRLERRIETVRSVRCGRARRGPLLSAPRRAPRLVDLFLLLSRRRHRRDLSRQARAEHRGPHGRLLTTTRRDRWRRRGIDLDVVAREAAFLAVELAVPPRRITVPLLRHHFDPVALLKRELVPLVRFAVVQRYGNASHLAREYSADLFLFFFSFLLVLNNTCPF